MKDPGALRRKLLAWFDRHKRDLPWRRTRDPYAIWVAEIMLQQTQVSTVVPYFERFLQRFPEARTLARARLPQVLSLWRGLGYYARARNLHRAARLVSSEGMPRSSGELRSLPGVGRYTAAAIASIAFGEPVAVLDGNVARVIARLSGRRGSLESGGARRFLWDEASRLLAPRRPGAFNEAMMELGATVCTPESPRCAACPLSGACKARSAGLQGSIPPPRSRPVRRKLALACAVIADAKGRLLLARRPEGGLFGGLWELPSVEMKRLSAPRALASAGFAPLGRALRPTIRRTLSHRELELTLVSTRPPRGLEGWLEHRWTSESRARALGTSSAMAAAMDLAFATVRKR